MLKYGEATVKAICDNCQIEFSRKYQLLNRNSRKYHYCCHDCSIDHKSKLYRFKQLHNQCEECGESYKVNQSQLNNGSRFCSSECLASWQSSAYKGENNHNYVKRVSYNCDFCGEEFKELSSKLQNNKHNFCSKLCYGVWRKNVYEKQANVIENKRKTMLDNLNNGRISSTLTKPHLKITDILDKNNIRYKEEMCDNLFSYDVYLTDYDLYIEINGGYWHCDHRFYKRSINKTQLNSIINDKRRKSYVKNSKNKDILFLWEHDIINREDVCECLIFEFIKNDGVLHDYNSFNYLLNDELFLNKNIEVPYMDRDYSQIVKLVDNEIREKRTTYRKNKHITFNCENCGKQKEQLLSHYNKCKNHFCSQDCAIKFKQVTYNCDECGKNFIIPKSKFKNYQEGRVKSICCSKGCKNKHISNNSNILVKT